MWRVRCERCGMHAVKGTRREAERIAEQHPHLGVWISNEERVYRVFTWGMLGKSLRVGRVVR